MGQNAAVEYNDGQLLAGGFDRRSQRRSRIRRDDEQIAVAARNEGVDVRDLLVVLALRVGDGEGFDVVLEDVDLRLHVGPADDAPWIEEAGVGKANPVWSGLLVLRGVNLLAVEMLLPGLIGGALRGHREEILGGLELLRIVEILGERAAGDAGQGDPRNS